MTRKICVVSGSRADYGLLSNVMAGLRAAPDVDLQIVGTWDCPGVGYRLLQRSDDTSSGIARATGKLVGDFASLFAKIIPDLLVLLGDRYEIFAAATAALIARIPIAHIHGGETTEGAFDEALRHSITKMSHLHFVAAEPYRKRVIQLGENPRRVFCVGGLGVDSIIQAPLMCRQEVENELGFSLGKNALLVVFHPVTLENATAQAQMTELLDALQAVDAQLLFVMPNTDPGNQVIRVMIDRFVAANTNAHGIENLPQAVYLACLLHVDGIIGNSSSGLLEAPSLRKGSINIGDRQKGRLKAASVIDCAPTCVAIFAAIKKLYSPKFQKSLPAVKNPCGTGGASAKIVKALREHPLDLLKKSFHDL